jgi:hypothetical protein
MSVSLGKLSYVLLDTIEEEPGIWRCGYQIRDEMGRDMGAVTTPMAGRHTKEDAEADARAQADRTIAAMDRPDRVSE